MNIVECFEQALLDAPSSDFLIYQSEVFTYCETSNIAEKLLLKIPEEANIIFISFSKKSPLLYALIIAAWRLHKIIMPIEPDNISHVLKLVSYYTKQDILISDHIIKNFNNKEYRFFEKMFSSHYSDLYMYHIDGLNAISLSSEIAYILNTSGSTGVPKQVPISHRNLDSYINSITSVLPLSYHERISGVFYPTFDLFFHDFLYACITRSAIIIINKNNYINLHNIINNSKITHWFSVPSLINFVVKLSSTCSVYPHVKMSLFCGESLDLFTLNDWFRLFPNTEVFNLYGPTEATIAVSSYKVKNTSSLHGIAPIGRFFPNVKYKVSQDFSEEGSKGELLLSGKQIFSGYLTKGLPENLDQQQWFKTGDIVSIDENNNFIFHGRNDRQVKINGFRVELQSIESNLKKTFSINDIAVLPAKNENNINYGGIIILTTCSNLNEEKISQISFMRNIPVKKIICLTQFPYNKNGKLDYKKLGEVYAC